MNKESIKRRLIVLMDGNTKFELTKAVRLTESRTFSLDELAKFVEDYNIKLDDDYIYEIINAAEELDDWKLYKAMSTIETLDEYIYWDWDDNDFYCTDPITIEELKEAKDIIDFNMD